MRVLRLLVRGLSYSGSTKALCVEPSTVKYHVINMLQKTGLENKLQPAIAASEQSRWQNWQRNKALQTAVKLVSAG